MDFVLYNIYSFPSSLATVSSVSLSSPPKSASSSPKQAGLVQTQSLLIWRTEHFILMLWVTDEHTWNMWNFWDIWWQIISVEFLPLNHFFGSGLELLPSNESFYTEHVIWSFVPVFELRCGFPKHALTWIVPLATASAEGTCVWLTHAHSLTGINHGLPMTAVTAFPTAAGRKPERLLSFQNKSQLKQQQQQQLTFAWRCFHFKHTSIIFRYYSHNVKMWHCGKRICPLASVTGSWNQAWVNMYEVTLPSGMTGCF